jgi:DNA polymerase (family 10)
VASTLPRNGELADRFDLLGDLLELEGEASYRVLAYRRAAKSIRDTGGSVAQMALEGKAKQLPGVGETIQAKIVEIVQTGDLEALRKRRDGVPVDVVAFMKLPGLGPKTARRIWKELGVATLDQLRAAAEQQQLRTLGGVGPKVEENVLKALAAAPSAPVGTLLGRALPAVQAAIEELREHPALDKVSEAGSVRRRKETVRDLDIIATASDPAALTAHFVSLPWVAEVAAHGTTKATVVSQEGLRFDLRVVPPECYGNLLQHFTGSKEHNVALRERAVRDGLSVSEYGVAVVETAETFTAPDEASLYERLGYAYIPPELRENRGELDAARKGTLPELVELQQLRGDLHSHTTWSDGKASLDEMVDAAIARGYDYLAVCDHSQRLREGRIEQQWEAIAAVNERVAPFRVLRGIEVNIRADGSLDFPDELLAECDWVMASVHNGFDNNPNERVAAAMESPHVDCIGHLTSRKIGKREPSSIDVDRVIEKALETGTFLEINSQPDRMDLRDAHARAAGEAGVRIVINSDGHSQTALGYVELGVGTARRAWLAKEQIVNTRTWKQVERLRKKQR